MLLCEIMHHSIETIACQPSGLSRECNISTSLHFDFYPTPRRKRHCYNPHHFGPIVYLEDLHKHVFIVINCFHCWKNATIRSKIADDIYLMVKLLKLWGTQTPTSSPVTQLATRICSFYEDVTVVIILVLFLQFPRVLLSLCNSYSCLCVLTPFSE